MRTYSPINKSGWTEWVSPRLTRNYRMKCCDCGLVHEVQFQVMRPTGRKDGGWLGEKVQGFKVLMRMRREVNNERS